MKPSEYPGIQQAADEASCRAQKKYISLMRFNLLLCVTGSAITVYNFVQEDPRWVVYLISMLTLLGALALTIAIKYHKLEDLWYQGRALAESVKTLTWRYISGSENFEINLPIGSADKNLVTEIDSLVAIFPDLMSFMKVRLLQIDVISDEMTRVRGLPWQQRQQIYLQRRVMNQIDWYSRKAQKNKIMRRNWLRVVIVSQILSVFACGALLFWPTTSVNFVGLFTTIAS